MISEAMLGLGLVPVGGLGPSTGSSILPSSTIYMATSPSWLQAPDWKSGDAGSNAAVAYVCARSLRHERTVEYIVIGSP